MKITCAIKEPQVEKLYANVYGKMFKALEAGETFDPKSYMQDLFDKIAQKKDEETAAKFVQQVPSLMYLALGKPKLIKLKVDSNAVREMIGTFKDEDAGILNTIKEFRKEIDPSSIASLAEAKEQNAFNLKEVDPQEEETSNPIRLKPYSVFTATFQEFAALNPEYKDAVTREVADESKRRIYKTLSNIKREIGNDQTLLDNIKYQGVTLKLKAVRVTELDQTKLDNYTRELIKRSLAIQKQGNQKEGVTKIQDVLALVLSDANGNEIFFDEEGNITTEANGKLVYQFMRDVKANKGVYTVTDIYGKENQIATAKTIAKLEGISEEEAYKRQQEEFKEAFDFKQKVLSSGAQVIDFVNVSPGIDQSVTTTRLSFKKLKSMAVGTRDTFASIRIADEFSDFETGSAIITINDQDFNIDRPAMTESLARKIAAILTSKNKDITPTIKNEFVSQFLSNDTAESVRRHYLLFDPKNKKFEFWYNDFTLNERLKSGVSKDNNINLRDLRSYSNEELQAIRDKIVEVLMNASSNKKDANLKYPTKIRISKENLQSGLYKEYDEATDSIVDAQSYVDFVMDLNGIVIMNQTTDPGFFNSYIQFRLPSQVTKDIDQAKKDQEQSDARSFVRRLKDATVDHINSKDGAIEVEVLSSAMGINATTKKPYAYFTYTSPVPGFEGSVTRVYMDPSLRENQEMLPKQGETVILAVEDLGYEYPVVTAYNQEMDELGSQQETDYKNSETPRDNTVRKATQELKNEVDVSESINPTDTENPSEGGLSDLFSLDRKGSLPNKVTKEDIDNAKTWWDESPLSKFISLNQVANIVNSDAYARFVVAGENLIDTQILINAGKGGTMADVYHESWHAFSQLYLTRDEKIKLYKELRNSKPEYKNLSFYQLEEILAEDFRSYALDQKVKKDSPKRNTLFRRILNFLKNLFSTRTYKDQLFNTLYFAGKNPSLLNKYTPLIDNVMFDMLNRGASQVSQPNQPALSSQDSKKVAESMDSILSEIIDEIYTDKKNKAQKLNRADLDHKGGTIKVLHDPKNKVVAYDVIKQRIQRKLDAYKKQLGQVVETSFDNLETKKDLAKNASAIIKDKQGNDIYVFLTSQVDSYDNLSLNTLNGLRMKGQTYDGVDIITDFYTHNKLVNSDESPVEIMIVPTVKEAITQYDNYRVAGDDLTSIDVKEQPELKPLNAEQLDLLDKIRILQTTINNFGDSKQGIVKYHIENSRYQILRERYVELDDITDAETLEESERAGGKVKDGQESLEQLASKETLYILASLHKKTNGKYVEDSLGFKKLADFRTVWNTTSKMIAGVKDPAEQYDILKAAIPQFPEFEQLITYKIPEPSQEASANTNRNEFKITTAFYRDFGRKTKIDYIQNTIFENGLIEVVTASVSTPNLINKFEQNFKTDVTNPFVERGPENIPVLNMPLLIQEFQDRNTGKLKKNGQIDFARALGISLDYNDEILKELDKENAASYYGLPYMFEIIKKLSQLESNPGTPVDVRQYIIDFKKSPVSKLRGKIPAGVISDKESSQLTQIKRLAELQIRFGSDGALFSTKNAEGNTVYQFINDHSIAMKIYALNQATRLDQLWTTDKFKYMSGFNPAVNPYTNRLQIIRNLFDFTDPELKKRSGKSLKLFMSSGSQVNDEIGNSTTSLDVDSKFLQELNGLLKGGVKEFMRHADKSSAFGSMIEGGIIDATGGVKRDPKLWVDIDKFGQGTGEAYAIQAHLLPYIAAELDRINIFKSNKEEFLNYDGYNRELGVDDKGNKIYAGEVFTAFDNVLRTETKNEIYRKVTSGDLIEYLKTDPELKEKITRDLIDYFNQQTGVNYSFLQKNKHISPDLINKLKVFGLAESEIEVALVKAYTYNSWIHNFETGIINYGDFAIYDHGSDQFHKRNTGASSNGTGFRTDMASRNYVNNVLNKTSYAKSLSEKTGDTTYESFDYDGTFNTAIMQEIKKESRYLPLYKNAFKKFYTKQFANTKREDIIEWFSKEELSKIGNDLADLRKALVDKFVDLETEAYAEMKTADGQGYLTFDAYRTLKDLEGNWSDLQEELFQKIVKGEKVSPGQIEEFFPVYKVQNFGPLAGTKLPVESMHKFSLMPLIPGMYPEGSNYDKLHKQMLKKGVQYVTFESGSKGGSISNKGEATEVFKEGSNDKAVKDDINFISNRIYLEYLKNVANMSEYFKGKTIYASQARGIAIENLFDNGEIVSENLKDQYNNYKNSVADLREVLELELLEEIGFEKVDGKYKGDLTKFLSVVERELGRKEVPEHLIKFIGVNPDNTLKTDLSFHPNSDEIEKLIVGMIQKRLVKQKVNGEAFIQVSSAFTEGLWDTDLPKESVGEILKFTGTTTLPFYYSKLDGKTAAPKVAIAMQGDFENLYNLYYKGKPIGDLDTLNIAIKDDGWLDANDGQNRKAISLFSVRIPIDALGTMLYPEVYHFLDPAAGNIMIVPDELVASSGGDFDGDKLTTALPNINKFGKVYTKKYSNKELAAKVAELKAQGKKGQALQLIKNQKKAVENNLIQDVRSILEAPENFVNLIRPNGVYYFKSIAEELEPLVSDYNKFVNMHNEPSRLQKGRKAMSPTRVLEERHNLNKHEKNLVGGKSLGTTAINNKLKSILDSIGAKLPVTYKASTYDDAKKKYVDLERNFRTRVFLPVNKITVNGIEHISLSRRYAADEIANIATSYSHKLNGILDRGKDDWIFNIQANPQIEPISSHLSEAGVPIKQYIYFISNPLVREYAAKQRIYKSAYAKFTGHELTAPAFAQYQSYKDVLEEYIPELVRNGLENAPEEVFVNYFVMEPYVDLIGENRERRKYVSEVMSKENLLAQIESGTIDINNITVIGKDKGSAYNYRNAYYVNPVPTNKNFYDLSTYYSGLPGVLNDKGHFDLNKMKDIVNDIETPEYLNLKVAMFIHFIELEKQSKGISNLKRQMNPDTRTSKTMQEVVGRAVSLDELNEQSKLDPETKRRAINESILAPFFDNTLIEDVIKEVLPFRNNDTVTDFIITVLRENYGDISKRFGYGREATAKFITTFKNAINNYAYQTNMPTLFDPEGNEITFARMTGSGKDSYTVMLFDTIKKHLRSDLIKRNYPILEQLTPISTARNNQKSVTLNDRRDLKGDLAEIYYQNIKDLANPNIRKVDNPEVNMYISQMFSLLAPVSMYLNGQGFSPYGINNALPFDEYVRVMERSAQEFLNQQLDEGVLYTVFDSVVKDNKVFKNYKVEVTPEIPTVQIPVQAPDLLVEETQADVLPTAEDFETGELLAKKTFGLPAPTVETPTQLGSETKINIYASTGENAELSNFAIRPFTLSLDDLMENKIEIVQGDTFTSVEQAFQVMKYHYLNWNTAAPNNSKEQQDAIDKVINEIERTTDGPTIKRLGKKVNLSKEQIEAWDKVSSKYMKDFITQSFKQNPDALAKLLATGNATLTHTQDKGKWGIEFPRLLMEVRNELKGIQPSTQPTGSKIVLSHFTTPKKAAAIRKEGYITNKPSIFTVSTLQDTTKGIRKSLMPNVIYLTKDDTRWAEAKNIFVGEGKGNEDFTFYDYSGNRGWITLKNAAKSLKLERVDFLLDSNARILTIDSLDKFKNLTEEAEKYFANKFGKKSFDFRKDYLPYMEELYGKDFFTDSPVVLLAQYAKENNYDAFNIKDDGKWISEKSDKYGNKNLYESITGNSGKDDFFVFNQDVVSQSIEPAVQPTGVKVISEPYGVVVAETNPSKSKTQEFVNLIQPQIQAQAYKENASGTANDMFMYGLRWTRKRTANKPLNNKSYANKGLPITDAKATDGYVYDTVDQNGNPLAPVSDLQPIINEIQSSLGIDMSNYDAVIGNIYLPGQNIATHRDTTESLSARNYPVVVYTIGNDSGIGIYEDKKNPGSPTFASDSKRTIPTKNGTIYTFGMDGKGRFELAHDTPKGIKRDQKFPPITLPNGTVVENYTITLTFRRAADLEKGMPTTPVQPTAQPLVLPIPGGKNKLVSDTVIEEFNAAIEANNGLLPKLFTTSSSDQDAFGNEESGKKADSEEVNTWQLNPNGFYNLVDPTTGEIFLRNVNLKTGFQETLPVDTTPVNERKRGELIRDLDEGIKEYRLDEVFALKGYDIKDIINRVYSAKTQDEFDKIMVLIKKITC